MPLTEKHELVWCREILEATQGAVVAELGAHHGTDTSFLYDYCPGGPALYVAVEADPRNLNNIRCHMATRQKNFTLIHAAIAAFDGSVDLYQADGEKGSGSSSIRRPKKHLETWPDITFERTVEVPALSLDTLARWCEIPDIDLLWCDIQGAERDMIAGGQKTLARTRWLLAEADVEEYYEGQALRDELPGLLPGWELVAEWPEHANLLFRRVAVKGSTL
jgi:FkbM family methyltransferase